MKLLYLQDADAGSLASRVAKITEEWADFGIEGWELRATQSRNALLRAVAADAESGQDSVALVDLRSETGDIEQVGFRIVETIRRRPDLARVCRPLICTEEMTAANARYADTVGAFAVIDTTWAYAQAGPTITEALDWALGETASELRLHRRRALLLPEEGADEDDEERDQEAHFRAWFGFAPNDLHLALLWGMANAVELEFLKSYVAEAGLAVSPRAAKRHLERLQQAMAVEVEAMDRPETARAEIARRFLAEVVPPQPDPLPELNWPMLAHVREIWESEREIVRRAFLEPGGAGVVEAFFESLIVPARGARDRHTALGRAIEHAAVRKDLPIATAAAIAHRALHALDDAWGDQRLHGVDGVVTVAGV